MSDLAVITGSGGLIGSEAARYFVEQGYEVLGLDNDLRATFFGEEASTRAVTQRLVEDLEGFRAESVDIRDRQRVDSLFAAEKDRITLVVHAAAQPSHDWAARDPHTDFTVNANGTLTLLEATRSHCPDATFVLCSTNKVYGDRPNLLPLQEQETRLELPVDHPYYGGIPTDLSIDACTHSLFGVSKASADLLVQEYGRYFGMPTVCFRGGCLTGPQHAGAQLHGFLAYLMKCAATGSHYTVIGYGGKQVRDNIHCGDVVRAFDAFHRAPRAGAVYNLGGGRVSNVSVLEAVELCQQITGRQLSHNFVDDARIGDHRWWISDVSSFQADYPDWTITRGIEDLLREIFDANADRWTANPG